ncbi:QWRF motif-containing protein 7-like [Triticum dicoccoides]|uniref:QWRF motif-containing protein 7-like n=1 Tax=Triticum dicoccoides TaxID=85692 RepID=UPI00188EF69D|nr:QWRF motif-containing protein 7-like [Triticum dicoccoides]
MESNGASTTRHPMPSPHRLARSPGSASRAAPAFSTANFVRSLCKAASFGYRKPSAGVADSADTTRRRSADTVVMSPCRSSPEPGFAARGAWDHQTRRRRSTGQSSPSEGVGRGPSVPRKTPTTPKKEDVAHRARVLTARLMQWRLANARMEKAMTRATYAAESKLLYVWRRVAELRNIHTAKRIVAQRWRQKVKLGRLLRPQLPVLAAWETLGEPHSDAVADLGRVLSAASTSLPLSDGARANLELLHETMLACAGTVDEIKARADMFYATGSVTSSSVDELARTMQEEMAGLEEVMRLCRIVTDLQVQEVSLRANLIQAKQKIDYS